VGSISINGLRALAGLGRFNGINIRPVWSGPGTGLGR